MTDPREPDQPSDDQPEEAPDEGIYELAHVEEEPAPPDASRVPGPLPAPKATGVRCAHCQYDLSGTPVGANCPECGTPVAETIRRLQQVGKSPETNTTAIVCLVLGILSIGCCALTGPVAIALYVKVHHDLRDQPEAGAARTMGVIGLVLGSIGTLLLIGQALGLVVRMF